MRQLQRQAFAWLKRHDPEFNWDTYDRVAATMKWPRDYVGAVRDNLRDFGTANAGRISRALKRKVWPRGTSKA